MPEVEPYFASYEDLKVHMVMLNDTARVKAFKEAIMANAEFIKGKTVLDLGAGTGILSVFCAKAGAAKVYAVEAAPAIIPVLKGVIDENEVQDVVTVFQGAIEDVLLPTLVDVIVSEFMGFYLLHEAMLPSVIYARDKYLRERGLILPSECHLFMAPCEVPGFYGSWESVEGVKLTTYADYLRRATCKSPSVQYIAPENLLAQPVVLSSFSLSVVTLKDIERLQRSGLFVAARSGNCQGIVIWFDVTFTSGVLLSTGPFAPLTHWQQTVVVLPSQVEVSIGDPFAFRIEIIKDGPRKYKIECTGLDPDSLNHNIPCHCNTLRCAIIADYWCNTPNPDESFDDMIRFPT